MEYLGDDCVVSCQVDDYESNRESVEGEQMIKWLLGIPPKLESVWVQRGDFPPSRLIYVVTNIDTKFVDFEYGYPESTCWVSDRCSVRGFRFRYRELK